jgi:hypothetical protein
VLDPASHPVLDCLKRRGLQPARWNPSRRLFLPRNITDAERNRLLELWRDYGFRLLVRDLLARCERARLADLTRFCSENAATRFLVELERLRLVRKLGPRTYACTVGDSGSFGVTLEWYLSELLREEFAAPALWGVRVRRLSPGDFDVLATLGPRLLYVEAKSSPPKHIHEPEVRAFWKRLAGLQPDIAFYFVDTHLRMKDKIVALFDEVLPEYGIAGTNVEPKIERLHDEIFHIGGRAFVINSHRSIEENFRRCIRHTQPVLYEKRRGRR